MLYLEDYVELIEHLPVDLRDRFTDMREMDLQVQNTVDNLNGQVKSLFRDCLAKKGKVENADELFERIRTGYRKALDDADENVQMAGQVYDLVDRHLRKLDQELAKFKMELEADNGGITEILERRSLELDNPMPNSNHGLGRRHAHGGMVSSHTSTILAALGTPNGSEEKRLKIDDTLGTWNHSESAPPSVRAPDIARITPGFESDRSRSRSPPHSASDSRHSTGGSNDVSVFPITSIGTDASAARRAVGGVNNKGKGAVYKSQDTHVKTESMSYQNAANEVQTQLQQDFIDEDSTQSVHDVTLSSPSCHGSLRPSRTKKQTSRAAAWSQERMQAEARRGQAREREHSADGVATSAEWASDAQEPRYCLCNQLSYGEMVACDNDKCAIEWFHYGCVGLDEAPRGKWFCPQCTQSMKRRNKNR